MTRRTARRRTPKARRAVRDRLHLRTPAPIGLAGSAPAAPLAPVAGPVPPSATLARSPLSPLVFA